MSLFFLCTAVCFTAFFLWKYLTKRKKLSGSRRISLCAAAVLLLLILLALAWVFDSYPAGSEAAKCLASDESVRVERIEKGWRFDGPGDRALIFYPGAKVEAAAYAPLMHTLAAGGLDICLVEMPLHIAFFGVNAAEQCMAAFPAAEWYIGGHSLGGVVAAMYAGARPEAIRGLVFLASYPSVPLPEGLRSLSVYGDRDRVLNREKYNDSRPKLPPESEELVLAGGNHAGFGCYGSQRGDGEAGIPAAQQQADTARAILDWIGE